MRYSILIVVALALGWAGHRLNAQATPYTCPTETEFLSEAPFTPETLAGILGFAHPSLEEVAQMHRSPGLRANNNYFFKITCTRLTGTETIYLILYHKPPDNPSSYEMSIRMYRLNNGIPEQTSSIGLSDTRWLHHLSTIHGFADRNFNGLPDFYILGGTGGNISDHSSFRWFELDESGTLRNITPLPNPNGFEDLNNDGVPEIYDYHGFDRPGHGYYTALSRWWQLVDGAYRLIAVDVPEFQEPTIYVRINERESGNYDAKNRMESYLNQLDIHTICDAFTVPDAGGGSPAFVLRYNLYYILMYYYGWGDVNAGWQRIQMALDFAAACPESGQKTRFQEYIDEFRAYLSQPDLLPLWNG
jgi:hypothetical protein